MQNSSWKGPAILLGIIAVITVLWFFVKPILFEKGQRSTSDAGATTVIKWAGDDYAGYFFLRSPEMLKQAPRNGLALDFESDGGAYADRLKKFKDGDYDFIVLPIGQYIKHGLKHKYPGVVVYALAGSRGADAIVGFSDVMPNGNVNELNDPSLRIVYIPESPNSDLLDLTISDFDLNQLKADGSWRYEVDSAEEVYKLAEKAAKKGERSTAGDAFVLWEPLVSKAVNKLGLKVLWSSKNFKGYIEDVIVLHRDFVRKDKGDLARKLLKTYVRVLDSYARSRDRLVDDMSDILDLKESDVKEILDNKKIEFYDLRENCIELFGIQMGSRGSATNDLLIGSIISNVNAMDRIGTFDASKLPDPYRIVNSSFLEELAQSGIRSVGTAYNGPVDFAALNYAAWGNLQEVGTLVIEPITFQSGTNRLDNVGKGIVDKMAQLLNTNYPDYRVAVRGHTGPGYAEANMKLSKERADVVTQYLLAVHQVDPDRLRAEGYGNTKKPRRKPGEGTRAYRFRQQRVEFVLLRQNAL